MVIARPCHVTQLQKFKTGSNYEYENNHQREQSDITGRSYIFYLFSQFIVHTEKYKYLYRYILLDQVQRARFINAEKYSAT